MRFAAVFVMVFHWVMTKSTFGMCIQELNLFLQFLFICPVVITLKASNILAYGLRMYQ